MLSGAFSFNIFSCLQTADSARLKERRRRPSADYLRRKKSTLSPLPLFPKLWKIPSLLPMIPRSGSGGRPPQVGAAAHTCTDEAARTAPAQPSGSGGPPFLPSFPPPPFLGKQGHDHFRRELLQLRRREDAPAFLTSYGAPRPAPALPSALQSRGFGGLSRPVGEIISPDGVWGSAPPAFLPSLLPCFPPLLRFFLCRFSGRDLTGWPGLPIVRSIGKVTPLPFFFAEQSHIHHFSGEAMSFRLL